MTNTVPTTERYTPQVRRAKLRAFADRMLDHLDDLPPPQDQAEPSCSESASDLGDPFKGHSLDEDCDDDLLTEDQVPASDLFGQVFSPP